MELKYDDGIARDNLAQAGGYIVDFIPPFVPFTISKIRIFGVLAGTDWREKDFDIEIWNKSYKTIWNSSNSIDRFPTKAPSWVDFDVPAVQVSDKFFVHVYTGTGRLQGIHIGADDSIANLHSGTTIRPEQESAKIGLSLWPFHSTQWFGDRNKVNWMIRASGKYDTSSQNLNAPKQEIKTDIRISTSHKTERELATKNALDALLSQYDVSKWTLLKDIVIEEGATPHCCPIVLSTAYLSYDYQNLSCFIHEQLEQFFLTKRSQLNQAIAELRTIYPQVPTDSTGVQSDRTVDGTYKHLILCFNEFSAIKNLVNEETARLTIERKGHYLWVYKTVLKDTEKISTIAQKYDLIIN
jgi:hypothetical protein